MITELGHNGTENIHLHGIIWTNESLDTVEKIWKYGFIWKGKGDNKQNFVNELTVNYITKYITKVDFDHKYYKSKILSSKGIGSCYTKNNDITRNKFNYEKTIETYKTRSGHEIALPIYYRNKIYTDNEKELLWLQKLDKDERWICGEKLKNSNTEEYYKTLEWYRNINKKLGYGKLEIDWERKAYEEARRKLMYEKRLK